MYRFVYLYFYASGKSNKTNKTKFVKIKDNTIHNEDNNAMHFNSALQNTQRFTIAKLTK